MLQAYVSNERDRWAEWLPLLEHAFNASPSAITGASPFLLLYGFEPRDTFASQYPESIDRIDEKGRIRPEFVRELEDCRASARDVIARAQDHQASSYNKGHRPLELAPGDLVLVDPHSLQWKESKGEGVKLGQKFLGSFTVQERVGQNTYQLDLPGTFTGSNVLNIQHLLRYQESPAEWAGRTTLPDMHQLRESDEEFQVEKVVAHRFDRRMGDIKFLVRWEGYSALYDSWLTAKELRNAPRRLYTYREKQGI